MVVWVALFRGKYNVSMYTPFIFPIKELFLTANKKPKASKQKQTRTATRRRRQSMQAPSFRIRAAFSRWDAESGPVRRRLGRRMAPRSEPSLTEKIACEAKVGEISSPALYGVSPPASADVVTTALPLVTVVTVGEVEDVVSSRMCGEDGVDGVRP